LLAGDTAVLVGGGKPQVKLCVRGKTVSASGRADMFAVQEFAEKSYFKVSFWKYQLKSDSC